MAAGVLERGFSHLQGETRGAVAGLLDGLLRLLEYLLRLPGATGDHEVVEQQGEQACPQVRRHPGEVEGPAARLRAHLGGDGEQAGDAEADLGLLQGRQRLTQRTVGEGLCLLASGGGVQQDGGAGHQGAAQRVMLGGEVEGPAGEVGGLPGVGAAQSVAGLHQRGDGDLVARRGARSELGGDLHGQRAGGQQRGGYLAVEGVYGRAGLAGAHCLPVQVMGEAQHLAALGQQLAADELLDGVEQGRGGHLEDRGELAHGEPASHRRGDGGDVSGGRRHAGQTPAHAVAHPEREPGFGQRGAPRIEADEVLLAETGEQLHEKERVPPHAFGQGQQ